MKNPTTIKIPIPASESNSIRLALFFAAKNLREESKFEIEHGSRLDLLKAAARLEWLHDRSLDAEKELGQDFSDARYIHPGASDINELLENEH